MKIEKIGNNKDMRIIINEDENTVTFPDFTDEKGQPEIWTIDADSAGEKLFPIVNPYGEKLGFDGIQAILFNEFPGLAVQSVIDGYADAIRGGSWFDGDALQPVRFLDRNVGNLMRIKTMQGIADAKFAWTVYLQNPNSFERVFSFIDLNKTARPFLEPDEILTFDNIDEARKFKDSLSDDDLYKMFKNKDLKEAHLKKVMKSTRLSIKQILVKF